MTLEKELRTLHEPCLCLHFPESCQQKLWHVLRQVIEVQTDGSQDVKLRL
jgi:hypothetical protein